MANGDSMTEGKKRLTPKATSQYPHSINLKKKTIAGIIPVEEGRAFLDLGFVALDRCLGPPPVQEPPWGIKRHPEGVVLASTRPQPLVRSHYCPTEAFLSLIDFSHYINGFLHYRTRAFRFSSGCR